MSAQINAPKIFISYSWKPVQHQQKVIALAERLVGDGVDVVLDVWDLREGQDKNQFMESMVTDPEIKRVLLICNKDYKEKADGRKGGVGAESLIMSGEIYAKAKQTKFIPLVFEYDEEGKAYAPIFAQSRIYLDFQNDDTLEDNYEQLIRNIFDKPSRKKPPLGIAPSYLDDTISMTLPTAHRVSGIKNAFVNERRNAPLLVKQYYTVFLKALKDFEPKENEFKIDNFLELTLNKIEQTTSLRDDFVHFLETCLESYAGFDYDMLRSFFEELVRYYIDKTVSNYSNDTIYSLQYDYLRFFVYELVLYFAAILLKEEEFKILSEFLYENFIIIQQPSNAKSTDFRVLSGFCFTLNKHQNEKFDMNRVSVVADNIKRRASNSYSFDELKQADIILHHISELSGFVPNSSSRGLWRPETSAYYTPNMPVFAKMVSARYFDKIKVLFDIEDKQELIDKIQIFESDSTIQLWYRSSFFSTRDIPQLSNVINLEKLAIFK